jgi:large subunit ribosomal protein L6
MSRIGNRVLTIPNNVEVNIEKDLINISGPNGKLVVNYPKSVIELSKENNSITIKRKNELKQSKMFHGTVNANLNNAIIGVSIGFKKELVLKGVGYKAKVENDKLTLTLGFSHPVILDIPKDIKIETPTPTEIIITSNSKENLGQFAAIIRAYRKPEPYKGKGVLYKGEQIIRKAGKTADK